ncbi:MAG: hypothetical protein ABH821_03925 [archaeon]
MNSMDFSAAVIFIIGIVLLVVSWFVVWVDETASLGVIQLGICLMIVGVIIGLISVSHERLITMKKERKWLKGDNKHY